VAHTDSFSLRLTYTGAPIERASETRAVQTRMRELLSHPNAKFLPVCDGRHLFSVERADAVVLSASHYNDHHREFLDPIFLGFNETAPVFAVTLPGDPESHVLEDLGIFEQLHPRVGALDADQASTLAYARGMLLWQANHLYCGRCGTETESTQGGHTRQCKNEACGWRSFPRTDAAVITLVEHPDGERCVLGRQEKWPPGMYSVVAGFVEPGESLEECVVREVKEETGVTVERPLYVASQPWPFPSSLMLGFIAKATTIEFVPTDDELADIQWVSRRQLSEYGEMGENGDHAKLPNRHSIARMLIERWRTKDLDPYSSSGGAASSL